MCCAELRSIQGECGSRRRVSADAARACSNKSVDEFQRNFVGTSGAEWAFLCDFVVRQSPKPKSNKELRTRSGTVVVVRYSSRGGQSG